MYIRFFKYNQIPIYYFQGKEREVGQREGIWSYGRFALVEDMKAVGAQEVDTQDRIKWRLLIRCGDPWKGNKPKDEEDYFII